MEALSRKIELTIPHNWGKDEITLFLEKTNEQSHATFVKLKGEFLKLIEIDELFTKAQECAQNSKEYFPALFILKSHSAFLGAVRLAIGTQAPESYMVARGILECILYGFNIYKNPSYAKIWLTRDENKKNKKNVSDKFAIRGILRLLCKTDTGLSESAQKVYETTIEYGAHPNEKSLSAVLKMKKSKDAVTFNVQYLTDNIMAIRLSLVTIARAGLVSLKIAELILTERFKISLLSDRIKVACRGL
ncbi:hypothetical protein ACFL2J_04770 [Candidatus Omnitrophota bacterium]